MNVLPKTAFATTLSGPTVRLVSYRTGPRPLPFRGHMSKVLFDMSEYTPVTAE